MKTRIHSKESSYPNPFGPLLKVILTSSIASCNVEVTKMLKQEQQSVTKNCYRKLTSAQRYKIGKKGAEIGVTTAIR